MESLLAFADELERRDADVARRLLAVEALQHEVDELRTHATEAADFLRSLPAAQAARAGDEQAALDARARAETQLGEAERAVEQAKRDDDRLAAERAAQQARDDVHAAERWVEETIEARAELEREAAARRDEGAALETKAAELAAGVRDVPSPDGGLDGVVDWASRARGALLLEHSGLVAERDVLVREASELLGSVAGEPLAVTAVAGLRDRLSRTLA